MELLTKNNMNLLSFLQLQGMCIRPFPGLVNFAPAVACFLCLNLPATFSQPGNGLYFLSDDRSFPPPPLTRCPLPAFLLVQNSRIRDDKTKTKCVKNSGTRTRTWTSSGRERVPFLRKLHILQKRNASCEVTMIMTDRRFKSAFSIGRLVPRENLF